jgi:cytochrome b561
MALAIFGLFGLGFYMVDLTYYDDWYRSAPHIHKSVGMLFAALIILKLLMRVLNPPPPALASHKHWERISAHVAHWLMYALIVVVVVSGYLIPTADGSGIDVFGWFTIPSATGRIKGLETTAGKVHYWSTWLLVGLAGIHASGALKHHLIDRDQTLRRMLGTSRTKY